MKSNKYFLVRTKPLKNQTQTIRKDYLNQSENNESVIYLCKLHKDNVKPKWRKAHKDHITQRP